MFLYKTWGCIHAQHPHVLYDNMGMFLECKKRKEEILCKSLFHFQRTEEVRTVKIRLFYLYRIPRKKMRSLKFIAAFIEISFDLLSIQRSYLMFKEGTTKATSQVTSSTRSSKGVRPRLDQRCICAVTSAGACSRLFR